MPARTGNDYLESLKASPPNIWIGGEEVDDPTTHPAFRNVVRSIARLYDLQRRDGMTYPDAETGKPEGYSHIIPRTRDELIARNRAIKAWQDDCLGFMGRTPDYLNVSHAAMAAAREFFAQNDPRFGDNIAEYHRHVREHDLCMTHALTNPQVNRSAGASGQPDPYIALGVVKQTDRGVVVRGARMLATLPVAEEITVFPSTVLKADEHASRYALAFAIPTNLPGLKFICRESLDGGHAPADHPLGSRFEEMDALVVFDDVLVPWERVFILGDVGLCNTAYRETNAVLHMANQSTINKVSKTETFLGVAGLMAETIAITQFQHVQEKIAEIINVLEIMKGLWHASETNARLDRWGAMTPARGPLDAARNTYPRIYPRLVEIIQLLGASGLITIPPVSDLDSPVGPYLEKYLQARDAPARERLTLFRLAWDIALSAFGSRQVLYERFFFGDPVRMMSALYEIYDKQPVMDRVRSFLAEETRAREPVVTG